ncbi:MAG: FliM/FliN family flagellar motor switch protein [Gammaproteobacteria bacterium]
MATLSSALTGVLRKIDPAEHAARQKHLGLRYQHERANGESADHWSLQVTPQVRAQTWLQMATEGPPLGLAVRHRADAPLIGERHWHDYDGEARLMAWSLQHEGLIDALQRLLDRRLAPLAFADSPSHVDQSLAGPVVDFDLADDTGATTWSGSLALTSTLCDQLLGEAQSTPVEPLPKTWLGVPIPVAVRARGPKMALDVLRDCQPGDVIVLGQQQALHGSLLAVHIDGSALPARCTVNDNEISLSAGAPASWLREQPTKETPTMSEEGATATTLGSSIPVRLSIQTATVDVTINDLEQLGSGVILPLDVPVAGTNVTILANGAPIGEGELVAAGDKLAVCIGRWRPDGL